MAENTFVLKLSDGSGILDSLEKVAEDKGIQYGLLVGGCGKIKEFEIISSGPQGSVERMKSRDEFQLNAISGKIQKMPGGKLHTLVRVSITKTGFTPKDGQLISGKAAGALEICIRKVDLEKIIKA